MKNIIALLQELPQRHKKISALYQELDKGTKSRILVENLAGSFDCFAIKSILQLRVNTQLIIASDKESAAYMLNTLDNLTDDANVKFFPDSFKRPTKYEEISQLNILQRSEVINSFLSPNPLGSIVVSYPEALFEKVVSPFKVNESKIQFSIGETLDVKSFIEFVVELGFRREDYVYEPGQFSIRGSIMDVFTYGNEWPYRIELFDEEIESIRLFDPMTQLSKRNVKTVSIIPNFAENFNSADKVSILECLPKNTDIWIQDLDHFVDSIQVCEERSAEYASALVYDEEEILKNFLEEKAFVSKTDIFTSLSKYSVIFLKQSKLLKEKFNLSLSFKQTIQPVFNKNFSLLIEDLRRKQKDKYHIYIFSENPKQLSRFDHIFENHEAKIAYLPAIRSIHQGFVDDEIKLVCYTDHEIFQRHHRYNLRRGFTKDQAMSLKFLRGLIPGDFVVHIDHGVGKFSGLEKVDINGVLQEAVRILYKNNDLLHVSINSLHKVSKYIGKDGTPPSLDKIGSDSWKKLKSKTKSKVKDIAKELIQLYAQRKSTDGYAFDPDNYLQYELESSFLYEDTPDQMKATIDVKTDMEKSYPMDRLICGDVGFGKTEVALRAAFKSVVNGKQVAILVPTTILALQHARTFADRLSDFKIKVDYINRFRSKKEVKEIYQGVNDGKIEILIGTHALLNKELKFKDLGLLIIDEEQKFGVASKEKLRKFKINVDTLTLTATPIPRTLQFSLMAARDLSIIRTPPPNRQPIHTERRTFSEDLIKESIYNEVDRGGQVFFVHNRVKTLQEMVEVICRICPDVNVRYAHGQMESNHLETTLNDFIEGKIEVLVCTNIIETGLDISNANTMIINNAHHFGLSDLHQLRGRVGRSNKKAFCYLFTPPLSSLTQEAKKRIKTLEDFSELGSGFDIAMRDLDIRGAGNLLGGEQSGFIADIGYETYQKILEEAVIELKENEFKELFSDEIKHTDNIYVQDVEVETDEQMFLPTEYVSVTQDRLRLYSEMDQICNEDGIEEFKIKIKDRFGPIPVETMRIFDALRVRWSCKYLGIERVIYKEKRMKAFFVRNPQSRFYDSPVYTSIMQYILTHGASKYMNIQQTKHFLILSQEKVNSIDELRQGLEQIKQSIESIEPT